jgi:methionyl-tRNA formyltransferase
VAAKALVFGYGDIGVRCLAALLDAGVEVPLVVTHRDDPAEARWYASVSDFARQRDIEAAFSTEFPKEKIAALHPDFIFSFYYREMLPMSVLRLAKRGAYNMHGSLLPKYRGRAPLNWAILHGEKETGVTLHEMVEKPDAGGIVDRQAVCIGPDETAVEVFRKMTDAAESLLKRNIHALVEGQVSLKTNDLSKGSYFGRRRPEDGRIDWSRSARDIHNLVRAVAPPFPGAFSENLRVLKTRLTQSSHSRKTLGPYQEGGQWFAACGDGKVLRLLEIEQQ